jgi:hypothetical protein
MRTSVAFFTGAGTVVVAIAAGLGGGLLIADIVSPHASKQEMTKLERRMSPEPIPVSRAPSEPVQYLAGTQAVANPNAAAPAQNQQPTPSAQTTTDASSANNNAANAQPPPASREQAKAPEDAFAKVRDADVAKARDVDVRETRRAERERRRAERRQQWAERYRHVQRQDDELRDVELKIREETEPTQAFRAEPNRIEIPRIKLFGDD